MFKTDSFLDNIKLSLNQNVWRDHATMLQCFHFFLAPENMQKTPLKVAHTRSPTFFYVLARLPKRPKTEILYHQKPLNAGLGF